MAVRWWPNHPHRPLLLILSATALPTAVVVCIRWRTVAALFCSRRKAAVQFGVLPAYKPQYHPNLLRWSYRSPSTLRYAKGCEVALFRWLVVFASKFVASVLENHCCWFQLWYCRHISSLLIRNPLVSVIVLVVNNLVDWPYHNLAIDGYGLLCVDLAWKSVDACCDCC